MTTILTGRAITWYRMRVLQSCLELELKGIGVTRRSTYARVKREFKLKGNRESVLEQFKVLVEKERKESLKEGLQNATVRDLRST